MYGPHIAAITRCDLGQVFELNLDASEYESALYPPKSITKEQMEARGLKMPRMSLSEKPTLRIETTTVDTDERKEIFGHMARHVVTTRKEIPLGGSLSVPQETITDGWYIDLDQQLSCDLKWPTGTRFHSFGWVCGSGRARCVRCAPEFIDIGKQETGFPLQQVAITKLILPDGTEKQTGPKSEIQVTQFREGPLDPKLFEVPSGFKLVKQINQNPAPPGTFSMMEDSWERFKARLAGFFNL